MGRYFCLFFPDQETKYEAWTEFLSNLPDASEHLFLSRHTSLMRAERIVLHSLLLILVPKCTTHESHATLYREDGCHLTLLCCTVLGLTTHRRKFVLRSSFLVPRSSLVPRPSSLDSSVAFCILGLRSKTTPPRYPGSLYKTAFPARSSSRIPPPHPRLPSIRENSTDSSLPPLYNTTNPLLVIRETSSLHHFIKTKQHNIYLPKHHPIMLLVPVPLQSNRSLA